MRVLILSDTIPPENRGGAGIVTWRLACQLRDMGHDVFMIAATRQAYFEEVRDGISTYHIHVDYPERFHAWLSLYNPQVNGDLRRLYQQIQPDVINAHNIHAHLTYHSMQIAHDMGIPVVFSSHDVMPFAYHKMSYFIKRDQCDIESLNDYRLPPFFNLKQMRFRYNPLRNLTIRRILSHAVQIRTAPSQALCDAHHANGLPHFTCVHNGIDEAAFRASETVIQDLKTRLNLQDRKVILFAGRLTGAKGTRELLNVLLRVIEHVPTVALLVLSSVPINEQITDERYQTLADQHIIVGGWLDGKELAAAFHIADIMVAPSIIFDTFPTVNLEAMASHSVVMASCFGGSREAVIDGETGYIINPFATDDFANKMIRLLDDDTLRQDMAVSAYRRVHEMFTLEQQAQKMITYYQNAIESQ
ncbi:MAG: glycosyltransferase family 4 protein [Phototrophicaceae bacterium]